MDKLKNVKECLMAQLQAQMGNLAQVDAKELGEVVDMIKDLEEDIYYCTITKAMTEKEQSPMQKEHHYYYSSRLEPEYYYPKQEMGYNGWGLSDRMYYNGRGGNSGGGSGSSSGGNSGGSGGSSGGGSGSGSSGGGSSSSGSSGGRSYYSEYPIELRDYREGRSPKARKMYMESKEMHHSKSTKMHDLEQYMKELGSDITEMIEEASPEEKELLTNKLNHLAAKIDATGN